MTRTRLWREPREPAEKVTVLRPAHHNSHKSENAAIYEEIARAEEEVALLKEKVALAEEELRVVNADVKAAKEDLEQHRKENPILYALFIDPLVDKFLPFIDKLVLQKANNKANEAKSPEGPAYRPRTAQPKQMPPHP